MVESNSEILDAENLDGLTSGFQGIPLTAKGQIICGSVIMASLTRVPEALGADISARNILPEPLDIADHVGNTACTLGILGVAANRMWSSTTHLETDASYEKRRKRFAAFAGIGSLALNIIAEKVGYGVVSTPDSADFAYGMVGGLLTYVYLKPKHVSAPTIEFIDSLEYSDLSPSDDSIGNIKRIIDGLRLSRNNGTDNEREKEVSMATSKKEPTALSNADKRQMSYSSKNNTSAKAARRKQARRSRKRNKRK